MNIQEAKEKLKKEGYTSFELADFDKDFYNFLLPLKCNKETNLKNKYSQVRANIAYDKYYVDNNEFVGMNNNSSYKTHEEASKVVHNILDKINNTKGANLSQLWYYSDINNIIEPPYTLPNSEHIITGSNSLNQFENYIFNMVKYFFDFDETQKYTLFSPSISYYEKGCLLGNHSDGTGTGRICSLLIYLNEDYDENDGGILILQNKEKVVPVFGRVAIIDLQSFDIPHEVTEVTGGLGRFAVLSFVKKAEDKLIEY
jgi:Rps23 Pro-64 3,4-dihydroxylase Tpa1-like proline 4-hydroxylase